ncbi:MAG: hypothetical protein ABIT71_25945 [Vicinamibacteraceae bacterium]
MLRHIRRIALAAVLVPSTIAAQPVPAVRLSVSTGGTQANAPSQFEKVTPDGRTVLFVSTATNLVAGTGNGGAQLFVRDRDTDRDGVFDEPGAVGTVRVSSGPENQQNGDLFEGSDISPDGRFVLFTTATPIIAGDTNDTYDVYLRDRDADGDGIFDEAGAFTVTRVSTGTGNSQANGLSRGVQIAGNGRYVLFFSEATSLRGGAGFQFQYYRKDLLTGVTTLVSGRPDGTPADDVTWGAALSPDGHLAVIAGGFSDLAAASTFWVLRDLDANTFVPIIDGNPPASTLPARAPVTSAPLDIQNGRPLASIGFTPDARTVYLNVQENVFQPDEIRGSVLEYDIASARVVRRFPAVVPSSRTFLRPAFRDGRTLIYPSTIAFGCVDTARRIDRYDRLTGRIVPLLSGMVESVASDAAGRRLVYSHTGCTTPAPPTVHYLLDTAYGVPLPLPDPLVASPMDDAGTTLFFGAADGALLPNGAGDNGIADIYAVDLLSRLDRDSDGLDDRWEVAMGLDFTTASGNNGPTGDPDADGRTNLQELAAGTHPRGTSRQFLAEGADNAFFKTRLAIANPGLADATAVLRLDGDDGTASAVSVNVPAGARRTVFVDEIAGHAPSFATVVESSAPLISERTMSWDATEYGAHAERASPTPATSWFLAEGATGSFSLFYLLQNPGDAAVTATVRYLRPAPLAPIERAYTLPAHSRVTLPVNAQAPELAATDVSAAITATLPILVERAMYRSVGGQPFAAGHASAGVTATSTHWFLAEGATGDFFDLFILLANPTTTAADVEVRYLRTDGTVLTKTYAVAAESRRTIYVDGETFPGLGQALANASVSCAITSTNAVPIVVERSMWFPGPAVTPAFWAEAHNSPGTTTTATRWMLADGEAGGTRQAQTFVLIANTSATAGRVRVTALRDLPTTPTELPLPAPSVTLDLPANSRTTVPMHAIAALAETRFGVLVESIDTAPLAQIVVERAMYWNAGGAIWAAGTNLLATPLP